MVQKEPDNLKAQYMLGLVFLQKKMYPEAVKIFEQLYAGKEKELAAAALGYAYAKSERKSEARRILMEMDNKSKENPSPAQEKAIVLTGLGEKDEAIKWLEKSYQQHLYTLSSLKVEPLFDDLRSDPAFLSILRRMNLDY
jgi:tetratricopeptide (TPR) repeat protein